MDYYLNNTNCINRLKEEWDKYEKIVIAVDFDDTLFDFHKKGRTYDDIMDIIKRAQKIGCYTIIFTANDDIEHHKFIKEYLKEYNIKVDAINNNVAAVPYTTKKPYYNILLDDRAGLPSAYNSLLTAVTYMEFI
jgi:hydroxymethylpyrimidine pyrophosphatase-like HAD family hydrolase